MDSLLCYFIVLIELIVIFLCFQFESFADNAVPISIPVVGENNVGPIEIKYNPEQIQSTSDLLVSPVIPVIVKPEIVNSQETPGSVCSNASRKIFESPTGTTTLKDISNQV